jgi:hypothetical protein
MSIAKAKNTAFIHQTTNRMREKMKAPARADERDLIIKYLERFVCFDHIEKYACEHSACYTLRTMQRNIEMGAHLG